MPAFSPRCLIPALEAFPNAARCWIAYSGGMDSQVLLHAMASLRGNLPMELGAVHVDHGLHPDSTAWAEQCRRCCDDLGVPLTIRHLALAPVRGESLEALAREARYRVLQQVVGSGDLLLTAHHQDDQAETLLLALMRGSGIKGLAAMPAVAPFGGAWLLRTLLEYRRRDLLDYARRLGLAWLEDPSNANPAFDRNYLRTRVLPLLTKRWPACTAGLARTAGHCAEAQVLVDSMAARALDETRGLRPDTVSARQLSECPASLAAAVLRYWIGGLGLPVPSSRNLERIRGEVLVAAPDRSPLVKWPGCEVRRYRDDVFAMAPLPPRPPMMAFAWSRGVLQLPEGLGRLCLTDARGGALDPVQLWPRGLALRFAVGGFTCRPGPKARERRLKQLYQEAGIPPWLRPYVPLFFAGGRLVAVGDFWCCAAASPDTRSLAQIRWEGGLRVHAGFPEPTD